MKFKKMFEELKINGKYTMRNRVCCAPMAFALVACIPGVNEKSFRKLEAPARGGDAIVSVGELDVNFTNAVRIPLSPIDFKAKDGDIVKNIGEYARRIKKHGAIALCELAHPGAEKVPFDETQEAIGPIDEVRPNGVSVRAMTKEAMDKVVEDFAIAAKFVQNCGYDGVVIHGGHGFLFTQFLSSTYNKRDDEFGGSLENRAKFPIQILKGIREATGKDFIIELRVSGDDGYTDEKHGITPEETGKFAHMLEGIVDLIQISAGIYYHPVDTHQFSSMFVPHGVNAGISEIVKRYTKLPVGVVGGINSPEKIEEILEKGQADYVVLGRQSIADPELVNKIKAGEEDSIRRCLRCYKCFPGSPEEGYDDLPFDSKELAKTVGECTINPLANLPFDPYNLEPIKKSKKVLVVGGGVGGMQSVITAFDRGHQVILAEKDDKLGGVLFFTDTDIDKTDLCNFKNMMVKEVEKRDIKVLLKTEITLDKIKEINPDAIIFAVGAEPISPKIKGIENAYQSLEAYRGKVKLGETVIFIGGGLIGAEQGLYLAKTGHKVIIIEMLPRIANEAYGMYREALVKEISKENIEVLENTKCLEIYKDSIKVLTSEGKEEIIKGDTILYALGMKSVNMDEIKDNIEKDIEIKVIGDAKKPGKIDGAIRGGYLAAIEL